MKIAVFHNLPPGGAKRTIYEEVKHLSKKHEVYLYEYSSTNEQYKNLTSFVKRIFKFNFEIRSNLPGFLARLQKDFQNFIKLPLVHFKIARQINSGGYDVVLVHADKYTQAPFLLSFLKVPSLYFCQEYLRIAYEKELMFNESVMFLKKWYEGLTRRLRKYIDKKNAQAADVILANSRFTQDNIKKAWGLDSKVCHLGVDVKVFRPIHDRKINQALFIGEKSKINGYDLVLRVLQLIDKKIRPEIKVLGGRSNKIMKDNDKDLATQYSLSLFTICTSYSEPFGLAPIESMASGTLVLAVNEGGYKETVVDGATGYLLKRDAREFAKSAIYLIAHPKVIERMGKQGRAYVIKNFNWVKHLKIVEENLFKLT